MNEEKRKALETVRENALIAYNRSEYLIEQRGIDELVSYKHMIKRGSINGR